MLDPQARAHLEQQAALGLRPFSELTPEEARSQSEASAPVLAGPVEEVRSVSDGEIAGVPVRVYSPLPPGGDPPVAIHFHGGGWVIGSLDTHDGLCRALANRAGCQVVSVDYRLAPEHRFPAAVEDSWAVTREVLGRGAPVAVSGDSAGGNLAAVMALRARDAGLRLARQVLVYPVMDHSFDTRSYVDRAAGFGLTLDSMRWFWDCYLGGADGSHPDASPLRAPSLTGVAPAHVVVCEYDVLRDEGVAYAERLHEAGVPVQLSEYQGMIHGFARMPAVIDRSRQLVDEIALGLRESLGSVSRLDVRS